MEFDQLVVSATLAASLGLFAWGVWRYDVVALLALLVLVLFQIVPSEIAFNGFGHPAVVTVVAVFIISRALEASGAVDIIAKRLEQIGDNPIVMLGALCLLVTVCSAFMNNIGALALLLPVAVQLTGRGKLPRHMALMPLAFGSILGGMTTLIGTPPNIIISGYREQHLGAPFAIFDFAPVGVFVALGGAALAVALARWVLPVREPERAFDPYAQLEPYITEVIVTEESPLVGRPLLELDALGNGDAAVIELIRPDGFTLAPRARTILRANDVVVLEADPETLASILDTKQVELVHEKQFNPEHLSSDEIEITEAVVMPGARIESRTSVGMRLRSSFGINLLAISRKGSRVERRLGHERLRTGDVVLLQGDPDRMDETLARLGCLPLTARKLVLRQSFNYVPAVIFFAALGLSTAGLLKVHIALILAAVVLTMMRQISLRDAYDSVDWPIIVLLGAMVPVGGSLEATGVTGLIAGALSELLLSAPVWLVIMVLLLVALLLSNVINNAATAILMAPLAFAMASQTRRVARCVADGGRHRQLGRVPHADRPSVQSSGHGPRRVQFRRLLASRHAGIDPGLPAGSPPHSPVLGNMTGAPGAGHKFLGDPHDERTRQERRNNPANGGRSRNG